jgi:hypothetical protein
MASQVFPGNRDKEITPGQGGKCPCSQNGHPYDFIPVSIYYGIYQQFFFCSG